MSEKMGLKEIVNVRQYTDFSKAGKLQRMYEVTFTTKKTEGEFTFSVHQAEYSAEKAKALAEGMAEELDSIIK